MRRLRPGGGANPSRRWVCVAAAPPTVPAWRAEGRPSIVQHLHELAAPRSGRGVGPNFRPSCLPRSPQTRPKWGGESPTGPVTKLANTLQRLETDLRWALE